MRHYYSPLYRQVVDPVEPQSQPDAPTAIRRERVPALIDSLDCLLALWVAEATLDAGRSILRPSGDLPTQAQGLASAPGEHLHVG